MDRLIDVYEVEKTCEYKGDFYSVRDIMVLLCAILKMAKKPDHWIMYEHLVPSIFKKDIR
ncbi:Uncharacterised protein [Mycoplasmopsis arginini]|nr:Uncharacterised protein [Chlamydia abortus]SGA05627.1 Uncharacterised protein [Mycoplasmopsis arginini]SGA19960.1 Uncharacterised protein [Mycoplasmopsis arginini]SGA31232.1 Uncharacterised protein [Chlamydia abortus]